MIENPIVGLIGVVFVAVAIVAVIIAVGRYTRLTRRGRNDRNNLIGSDAWVTYQKLQHQLKNPKPEAEKAPTTGSSKATNSTDANGNM